ncbi:MAG: hypothetical protein DRO00_06215 [Thermoproteota archaeon]|nr:MAG: hypothetical protein DRO00_06215 [Candidatus Korarchaeota archaeon]
MGYEARAPVPRYLTFEILERMRYDGEIIKELDVEKAREVIEKLKSLNARGICRNLLPSLLRESFQRKKVRRTPEEGSTRD